MKVLWASRRVATDAGRQIQLRFDIGEWSIEALDGPTSTVLVVSPETMDQLVAEWPRIRAEAEK